MHTIKKVNVLFMCELIASIKVLKIILIMIGLNSYGENAIAVFLTYIEILKDI